MNKIDFAKINKKKDMIMAFNQLKDDYSILFQQTTQSTNNWNELEEIILKEIEKCKEDEKIIRQNKIPKFYDIGVCAGIHGTCKFILNKMKEIKEIKNDKN